MTFTPYGGVPPVQQQAATPAAGFALQNGTPLITSWTAPNDGKLHRISIYAAMNITLAETGGAIQVSFTMPDGSISAYTLFNAGQGLGYNFSSFNPPGLIIRAGSTVGISQASALTAGAATLWAEIWGSLAVPRWPAGLHLTAQSIPATGMRPRRIPRAPIEAYRRRLTDIPLTGAQAQGIIPGSGTLTLTIGPQGLGNVWYPVQITLTTTTGALDTSLANIYLGPLVTPATIVGTGLGNGAYALAIPPMQPGQYLVIVWTGAKPGDTAAANVIGTQDALAA